MPVVNRVREERMARSMTQRDLAEKVGCSRMTITYLETGRIQPGGELMLKIARVLEKPVEVLFEVVDDSVVQRVARLAGAVARRLPREVVITLLVFVLFLHGVGFAADRLSPTAGWLIHSYANAIGTPQRTLREAAALDVSPWKFISGHAYDTLGSDEAMSVTACGSWLRRYGTLDESVDQYDFYAEFVLERQAACFDKVGLSSDAVRVRKSLIELRTFTDLGFETLSATAGPKMAHAFELYFSARDAARFHDDAAASDLLHNAVAENPFVLYVVGRIHLMNVRSHGHLASVYSDVANVLPERTVRSEMHLARAVETLAYPTKGADRRVQRQRALRDAALALDAWPGITASVKSWISWPQNDAFKRQTLDLLARAAKMSQHERD